MQPAIIGILASNSEAREYFTSVLYPYAFGDDIAVNLPGPLLGSLWGLDIEDASIAMPTFLSGTLTETIVYQTYDRPIAVEDVGVGQPVLLAGTLAETIVYQTYDRPIAVEDVSVALPVLQSGTLVTTINYVDYDPPFSAADNARIDLPTILSGTLV